LRHPEAEQLWANSWVQGTCFIEAITTDAEVAGRCRDAQRAGSYVYVHRLVHAESQASVVSKAKVRNIQQVDRAFYLVLFKDQVDVGRAPLRPAQQGDRSYVERTVD
jgi:hypothetical protein